MPGPLGTQIACFVMLSCTSWEPTPLYEQYGYVLSNAHHGKVTIPHYLQSTYTFHEWVPVRVCATYLVHRNSIVVVCRVSCVSGQTLVSSVEQPTGTFLHASVRGRCSPCMFPKWTRSRGALVAFVSGGDWPLGIKIACCVVGFWSFCALQFSHGRLVCGPIAAIC